MIGMISIKLIIGVILLLFILFILLTGYVKAPPDVAYIISGIRRTPKVLIGRAGIKIPLLERKDFLIVKQISIDVKTNGYIPTFDFIGVDIDAVCKVRVITDDTVMIGDGDNVREVRGIDLAAKNFLNMGEDQIADALVDSLQGNMREIIGTVPLRELCNDRKKFGDEVQSKAQKDMNALGIRHIRNNLRVLLVNNNGGAEFKMGNLETKTDVSSFISAAGHYKTAKGWSETNGFKYLCAKDKDEFLAVVDEFLEGSEKPILLEIFTEASNERKANGLIRTANFEGTKAENVKNSIKKVLKQTLGADTIDNLKHKLS